MLTTQNMKLVLFLSFDILAGVGLKTSCPSAGVVGVAEEVEEVSSTFIRSPITTAFDCAELVLSTIPIRTESTSFKFVFEIVSVTLMTNKPPLVVLIRVHFAEWMNTKNMLWDVMHPNSKKISE